MLSKTAESSLRMYVETDPTLVWP
jgi:hypothetical protein